MDGEENGVHDSKWPQHLWEGEESSDSFFLNTGHLQVLIMPVHQFWWCHQAWPLIPGDPPSSDVFISGQMFAWPQQTGAYEHQIPVWWCRLHCFSCWREHFSALACKAGPVKQVWCVALTSQTESTTNDKRDILQPCCSEKIMQRCKGLLYSVPTAGFPLFTQTAAVNDKRIWCKISSYLPQLDKKSLSYFWELVHRSSTQLPSFDG